jgi:hypothetical protein
LCTDSTALILSNELWHPYKVEDKTSDGKNVYWYN